MWKNQLEVTRSNLRVVLLEEYVEKYFKLEAQFRSVFAKHIVRTYLLKVSNHLETGEKIASKEVKKITKIF